MSDWNGRTALVTGGSAGLGLAIAKALAARGARLALAARGAEQLARACEQVGGATPLIADLSVPGEGRRMVEQAAAELGRLDLVCHAAGRSGRGSIADTPAEEFDAMLRLNTLAAVEVAQAAAPHLIPTRGSLVLIGSLASHVAPRHMGAYPVSKFPLAALAQGLRMELGPSGLHTLFVCPGPIAREDAGSRYAHQAAGLPSGAAAPGGGARLRAIDPEWLAGRILDACRNRRAELVVPRKARLLFALSKLQPAWGDWLLRKMMRG